MGELFQYPGSSAVLGAPLFEDVCLNDQRIRGLDRRDIELAGV